jgi:POT family proton-dependent oligopeptide transporter
VVGFGYLINDALMAIGGINLFPFQVGGLSGNYFSILIALFIFLYLVTTRIFRYDKIVRDRMFAFIIFAFFTVFFWLSFEQGASSLVIFARDSVDRTLSGSSATIFNIINALLTVVPLGIITWVLVLLWKRTYKKIPVSNIVLVVSFIGLWGIAGWMINRDFNTVAYDIEYTSYRGDVIVDKDSKQPVLDDDGNVQYNYIAISENMSVPENAILKLDTLSIGEPIELAVGSDIYMIPKDKEGTKYGYLDETRLLSARENGTELKRDNGIVPGKVIAANNNEVTITVSWFSILNSFFIIALASFFSKWWESKYNPSGAGKYALGLIIMAIGFGLLAFGAYGLQDGVKVSMVWLVFAYLFHTMGELCISPVGLSYVSKLVPSRMIAFMFGMYYLAIAIGNKLAAVLGGQIENITKEYSLSTFFLIFTIVPATAGILIYLLSPALKKLMHGVK